MKTIPLYFTANLPAGRASSGPALVDRRIRILNTSIETLSFKEQKLIHITADDERDYIQQEITKLETSAAASVGLNGERRMMQ